jgi:hypothetical protein
MEARPKACQKIETNVSCWDLRSPHLYFRLSDCLAFSYSMICSLGPMWVLHMQYFISEIQSSCVLGLSGDGSMSQRGMGCPQLTATMDIHGRWSGRRQFLLSISQFERCLPHKGVGIALRSGSTLKTLSAQGASFGGVSYPRVSTVVGRLHTIKTERSVATGRWRAPAFWVGLLAGQRH